MEDDLHIHGIHDGGHSGSEATNQLHLLCLPDMVQEPRCHLAEDLAGVELHGSEGDAGTLPDSNHHRTFMVLHQKNLSEVGLFRLMAGGRQLLLQR